MQGYPACMSFTETRSPSAAAQRSAEVWRAAQSAHTPLSPNAQAWRRLAVEGYHRTAELVRATCSAPLQADEHDEADARDNATADAHHSGFQSL